LIESVLGSEKMRRERRFGQPLPPEPVELGKEYAVDIQEISRRGQGIARIEGFVIFVPDTRPGDRVTIKITRISPRFAEAEVVRKAAYESETE
jgi:predicted RNA-binding protein with TRAM domain